MPTNNGWQKKGTMNYKLTHRRIDLLRSALALYQVEYEDDPTTAGFTSEQEMVREFHATFQWLNQQQNKRNKKAS